MGRNFLSFSGVLLLTIACSQSADLENMAGRVKPSSLHQLTVLATNDIHGGVEPSPEYGGRTEFGGMAVLAEVVDAVRRGVQSKDGEVLLLDGGDQFQGTLVSNRNEGKLVFSLMKQIGYDAVVPGNHDYDFGPAGWTEDKVTPDTEQDSRGVLKSLIAASRDRIHFLSANTYVRDSLVDSAGKKVNAEPEGCRVKAGKTVNWAKAKRADFVEPYFIQTYPKWKLRVAVVGMDNPGTASSTTRENVEDLCFRSVADTYAEVREELKKKADVFLIVMHDGDVTASSKASDALKAFTESEPPLVDAIIAGHTHYENNKVLGKGVPFIQSKSGGRYIGRIDLVWDSAKKELVRSSTKQLAAMQLLDGACDSKATFCESKAGVVSYDGAPVRTNRVIRDEIATARKLVDKEAKRQVATAAGDLRVDRTSESSLGNLLSDELRALTVKRLPKKLAEQYSTEGEVNLVTFMNAGGIRKPLLKGPVLYQDIFEVLPFNNHGVVVAPVSAKSLVKQLDKNSKTCGRFGTLVWSGLKVEYRRDCKRNKETEQNQLDIGARVSKVVLVKTSGDVVLLDTDAGVNDAPDLDVLVSTLDFIAEGGEGFSDLSGRGTSKVLDLGVVRESLVAEWLALPTRKTWTDTIDGRNLLRGK